MNAKLFVILSIAIFVLGCVSNNSQTQSTPTTQPTQVNDAANKLATEPATQNAAPANDSAANSAQKKSDDKSQIKLDRVVYCADEPNTMNPDYCNEFVTSKSSSGRIYIAAVANNLECQNNSISASCTVILFQNGKEVFNQSKPISDNYKDGCKEPERRKALCKIYVQGPTNITKFYSANFEIKDFYSGQIVIVKGAEATIVPQGQ